MNSRKVILFAILMLISMVSVVSAATFSANGGQGVSTVGTGGDYATLAAAATDFSTYAGGCTGDWTLLILNSLTETSNIGFGNSTNGYTVTIKPQTGVTATITLSATAVNATYPGHFMIGVKQALSVSATSNFVLDGSNTVGGTTKDLTIVNASAAIANSRVILVYGNSDNVVIKNCNITNNSTNTAANGNVGVEFMSVASGTSIPENGRVENCTINANVGAATYGTGIQTTNSGTIPVGNAQTGYVFTNNIITARYRGIFLNQSASGTVSYNTISIINGAASLICQGIAHAFCNSTTGWTIDIYGNTFPQLQTANTAANYGIVAIDATGALGYGDRPTYNIHNNMIAGFNFAGGTTANQIYRGISCGSATTNYNVYHNSINMPYNLRVTCQTAGNVFAIGFLSTGFGSAFVNLKNNIIRLEQYGSVAAYYAYAIYRPLLSSIPAGTPYLKGLTSDFNDIWVNTAGTQPPRVGLFFTTSCATLANWQTATSQDSHSIATDPSTYWGGATDLHISSYPGDAYKCSNIDGITEDVDGQTRNSNPIMGCDEYNTSASGPEIHLPETTVNFGRNFITSAPYNGSPTQAKFKIWNLSNSTLNISDISRTAGSADFTVSSATSLTIPSNGSADVTLTFTPTSAGAKTATITITSDDGDEGSVNVTVNGYGTITKKFSESPNPGQGESGVGGTDDAYTSLYEAAEDFSNYPGGCTGDWTLYINGNLTETMPIGFGNLNNTYTITVKPGVGITPTVNLNQATLDTNVPGHIVVGTGNFSNLTTTLKTDNFIIDGDNNGGSPDRHLTLQTNNTAIANSRVITVWGDTDNTVIKNCIITARSTTLQVGIDVYSRAALQIPDNWTIENNQITAATQNNGTCIQTSASGTVTATNAQTGWIIRNNIMTARQRGIYLNQSADGNIYGNTIQVAVNLASVTGHAIYHLSCNTRPGWTMNIYNNTINSLTTISTTANQGLIAIEASGSAVTAGTPPTYNIYNNMISGYNFTGNNANAVYRAIYSATTNCYLNIFHNSIYMLADPQVTNAATSMNLSAIATFTTLTNSVITDIRNNIIKSDQNRMTGIYKSDVGSFTSDYNDWNLTGTGAAYGYYKATPYITLPNWQAATTQDINSKNINPTFVSTTDLHITAYQGPEFQGKPVGSITTDFDGDARNTVLPYIGADEKTNATATSDIYLPSGLPGNLPFGNALTIANGGVDVYKDLEVWNVGQATLNISNVTWGSGSADFVVDSFPASIPANGTSVVRIKYTPNTAGTVTAGFNIASDSLGGAEPNYAFNATGFGKDSKKFSEAPIGRGTSKIGGAGADYASLSEAAADFSSTAGGCTGDWNLLINTTSLTETTVSSFGNLTNGYTVTLKPNTGVVPPVVVTFTSAVTMNAVPGYLIVGTNNCTTLDSVIKTDNFIIDGSAIPMTFTNQSAAIANARMITIYGDSDNCQIKNCTITNLSTSNTANGCIGIDIMSRNINPPNTNYIPDNTRIENCVITSVTTSNYGTGIQATASGTITTTNAQQGYYIGNNIITARYYGILLGQSGGGSVIGNTIKVLNVTNGFLTNGIYHSASNNAPGWILNIANNNINQLTNATTTAAQGIMGIRLLGANASGNISVYNVINNMIGGFQFTGATNNLDLYYNGIYMDAAYCVANFYNNSINLDGNYTQVSGATAGRVAGISLFLTTLNGISDLRNNIIRVNQNTSYAIYKGTSNYNYYGDYNNFYVNGSNARVGRVGATNRDTLADWQADPYVLGQDTHSTSLNPAVSNGSGIYTGKWIQIGMGTINDLHFDGFTQAFYGSFINMPITMKDIDGQARRIPQPYIGADEIVSPNLLVNSFDFGKTSILTEGGTTIDQNVPVYNPNGVSPLNISNVQLIDGTSDFSIVSFPASIPPLGTSNIVVRFTPNSKGSWYAKFRLTTDNASDDVPDFYCFANTTKKLSVTGGSGVSSVGLNQSDDYATLADAAAEFNALGSGLTGDWTLIVSTNLQDLNNVYFGNATNGFTTTIKPQGDLPSTIYFENALVNTTYPGHLVIGIKNVTDTTPTKTDNFLIDGPTNPSKQLTIQNCSSGTANSRLVVVYGDSDNTIIRNAKINNYSVGGCIGIELVSRNASSTNFIPDNTTIQNCVITTNNPAANGIGIQAAASGTITAGNAQTGLKVLNNIINTRYLGVYMAQNASADVGGNTIQLTNCAASTLGYGIYHSTSNTTYGWTMNIYNNTINKLQTLNNAANYGLTGISVIGNGATGIAGLVYYNIFNNMIGGFEFKGATDNINQYYRGIVVGARACIMQIYNNSINMTNTTKVSGATPGYIAGISFTDTAFGNSYATADIRNNIISMTQPNGYAIYYPTFTGYSGNYNNIYVSGTNAKVGRFYLTDCAALSNWQQYSNQDKNSISLDPTIAQGSSPYDGKWANAATIPNDLHFDGYTNAFIGVSISHPEFAKDIDGQLRNPFHAYMGCDEKTSQYLPINNTNFGKTNIIGEGGSVIEQDVQITNNKGTTLNISDVQRIAGSDNFSVVSYPASLAPGNSGNVRVRLNPTAKNVHLAAFKVVTDDTSEPDVYIIAKANTTKKLSDGGGRGVSSVGCEATDDYPSLAAAAAEFNALTGGLSGDWKLIFSSFIIDPDDSPFGKSLNGNSLSFTANPGYDYTKALFTKNVVNTGAGYKGAIIIGSNSLTNEDALVKMDNVVIDGSKDGSGGRNLALERISNANNYSRVIDVVGDSDGAIIKNCIINNWSSANYACVGIEFLSRRTAGGQNLIVDNGRVENCQVLTMTNVYGIAIIQGQSGFIPSGIAQSGFVYTKNDIIARNRGMLMSQIGNASIYENNFMLDQITNSQFTVGIYHLSCNSATGWKMDIYNNVFKKLRTANNNVGWSGYGITAIELDGGSGSSEYNVFNNVITGFDLFGVTSINDPIYRAISIYSANGTYNIYHNSIFMPNFSQFANSTIAYCGAVNFPYPGFDGIANVKNNLVYNEHVGGSDIYFRTYCPTVTCDFNGWGIGPFTNTGSIDGAIYGTLSEWAAATGYDQYGGNEDPTYYWVSLSDLHLSGVPGDELTGTPLTEVPKDIDGGFRSTVAPYKGCDDPPVSTLAVSSAYDAPYPPVGNHYITLAKNLFAYVTTPNFYASSDIRYHCTGWDGGSGSIPATGSTTSLLAMFNAASTINWLWKAQYQLIAMADPDIAGQVTLDDEFTPATGWYDVDSTVTVKAMPATDGCAFDHWSGDLSGSINPKTIGMNAPNKTITAHYLVTDINLPATQLDFGIQGSPTDRNFNVQNIGDYELTIYSVTRTAGDADFSVVSFPSTISSSNNDNIVIRFTPSVYGPRSATFRIASSDPDEMILFFTVTGGGDAADIELSTPSGDDWGARLIGSGKQADTKIVRIANAGTQNLTISNYTLSGHDDIALESGPTTPTLILAGNFVDIVLNYTPTAAGEVSKIVTVYSNDADEPNVSRTIKGTGSPIANTPDPLDFGFAKTFGAGGIGVLSNLSIINNGTVDTTYTLNIVNPEFSSVITQIFVEHGKTEIIPIRYLPTAVENDISAYTLTSSEPGAPNLSGTLLGRGWTMTEGKRQIVDGAAGATVQVGSAGTYTTTRLVIPAGAFTGSRLVTIQEPANTQGRPNAVEVFIDPDPVVLASNATLFIEYHDSDLLLDINPGDIAAYWQYEAITRWSGAAYIALPSLTPTDLGSGKYETSADLNAFSIFATKNNKTSVMDWTLLNK